MTRFKHHKTWIHIQPIIYDTGEMTFEWTIYSSERIFSGFIPSLKVSQNNYKVILVLDIKSLPGFLGFCFCPKPQCDYGKAYIPLPLLRLQILGNLYTVTWLIYIFFGKFHLPLFGWYVNQIYPSNIVFLTHF